MVDKVPSVMANEEFKDRKSKLQDEEVEEGEKLIIPQRIIDLQRDLQKSITNILTAADAKESMRRTELENAHRLRLEQLENDLRSSQEKFDEITRGWSTAKEKVIPQELQEALNNQQQLCAALIEDKKKLINDLQQELKVGDDRYVKDLKKQAEELDLMMERMEDQVKTLTQAYREEMAQIQRIYQQESEILLTRDKTEWEQQMKELLDKELEWLAQRQKTVADYEELRYNGMMETAATQYSDYIEQTKQLQALDKEHQEVKAEMMMKNIKQSLQSSVDGMQKISLAYIKNRMTSLQADLKKLQAEYTIQAKQLEKKSQRLSAEYKREIDQYERVQRRIKHFAVVNVIKFEEMWLMIEAEVKELVERALVIDSLICKRLGLAWKRPPMAFMELSGPIQPQKQALRPARQAPVQSFQTRQVLQRSERMMDVSVGPRLKTDTESTDMEMYEERTVLQSESGAEVEEEKLPMETVKKVMELLCDEAGFLLDDILLDLLAPLEKDEQTIVKLSSLLSAFGLEEEDVPRLAHFLMKYRHQQREQTEGVCAELTESSNKAEEVETNPELIDSNYFVPALKSFLEQLTKSRESSARQCDSLQQLEVRDSSQDEAYWDSMGNVISEDKLKLWDAAENTLRQYHAVLTEISELVPETESLEQQNNELRMLLQQLLKSRVQVGAEPEMP